MEALLSGLSQDEVISLGKALGLEKSLKDMTDIPGMYVFC